MLSWDESEPLLIYQLFRLNSIHAASKRADKALKRDQTDPLLPVSRKPSQWHSSHPSSWTALYPISDCSPRFIWRKHVFWKLVTTKWSQFASKAQSGGGKYSRLHPKSSNITSALSVFRSSTLNLSHLHQFSYTAQLHLAIDDTFAIHRLVQDSSTQGSLAGNFAKTLLSTDTVTSLCQ